MTWPRTAHPGEILLQEFLIPLEISIQRLARETLLPQTIIEGIIDGSQRITPDTASRFSKFFGTGVRFWLDLQEACDKNHDETAETENFLQNLAASELMRLSKSRYQS